MEKNFVSFIFFLMLFSACDANCEKPNGWKDGRCQLCLDDQFIQDTIIKECHEGLVNPGCKQSHCSYPNHTLDLIPIPSPSSTQPPIASSSTAPPNSSSSDPGPSVNVVIIVCVVGGFVVILVVILVVVKFCKMKKQFCFKPQPNDTNVPLAALRGAQNDPGINPLENDPLVNPGEIPNGDVERGGG